METVFTTVTILLFLAVVGTFASITHDVRPSLTAREQDTLRSFLSSRWRQRNRTIDRAWTERVRTFPRSRKRALFAILLVVASVSIWAYPLWQAFCGR